MTCENERIFSVNFTCRCPEEMLDVSWQSEPLDLPLDMQKSIKKHWDSLPKDNIFNGRLARLDRWSYSGQGCHLALRPTDYRTLLYSNSHVQEICTLWGSDYLSRALGISAVLLSVDNFVIFMKRSANVGEFPECYDVFGGHIDVPPNENSPNVFSSMAQELKEEVGLDRSDYDLYLIGLIESTPNRKPELVFFASTFLTKEQILSRTHEAQDHIEFTHVHAIENGVELLNFLKTNKSGFSPSAFGSLCVYAKLYLTDVRKSRGY